MRLTPKYWHDPLYRNGLFLLGTTISTAIIGFIYWMIAARVYSPVDVGYGSAAISAFTLLSSLSLVGVNNTLIRFLPAFKKPEEMINTAITSTGLISILITIIFVIGLGLFSPALSFIKDNLIFAIASVVFVTGCSLTSVLDGIFISGRKAQYILLMDTTVSILKLALVVILASIIGNYGIAASWGISIVIAAIIAVFVFIPRVQSNYKLIPMIKTDIVKQIWHYSSSNYLATILNCLPGWLLPIIILNILGSEQNAYYYIAWLIYSFIIAIPYAISNSLFAEASHNLADLHNIVNKSIRFTYALLIPAMILIIVFGPKVLWLFGTEYSAAGSSILTIMACSSIFAALVSIYNVILRVLNKMKELCILNLIHTALTLIPCFIFISKSGLIGIAYIWLCSQFVIFVYVCFVLKRTCAVSHNIMINS